MFVQIAIHLPTLTLKLPIGKKMETLWDGVVRRIAINEAANCPSGRLIE
ncbi:MAG: hypothetical protein NTU59_07660 [Coprothermobacterota bacterium]|nr:hypothetical protein [Coprothermobacterota bacterium]